MMSLLHTKTPSGFARPGFKRTSGKQRGVGLIEVLVAVLILALGLLGMAGLQSRSLSTNQSSYSRTQAVLLSYYILDAMRADRARAVAGNYNTAAAICDPASVSGSALSDINLQQWVTGLRASLGDANSTCGQVNFDTATGTATITIRWDDAKAGGRPDNTFTTTSRL